MNRTMRFAGFAMLLAFSTPALADSIRATLYKHPQCGCCEKYAAYLRHAGFAVDVKPTYDLAEIGRQAGIPEDKAGCHSMFIDGYVIDGHVPMNIVRKLLAERPAVAGITLPGMPTGSPGMTGAKSEKVTIYAVTKDGKAPVVYTVE